MPSDGDVEPTRNSMAARAQRAATEQRERERMSEPVLRRGLDSRMKAAERAHQQWTLYAVGLIALQVLSVVFLQAPWTERSIRREDGVVHSGWEIIGSTIPGRGWVLLVVVCLVVSALATFAALSQRSSPAFYGVMGASLVQLLAIALMLNSAVVGVDSQLARHGVVLSIIAAIATIVTAAYARAEMVP